MENTNESYADKNCSSERVSHAYSMHEENHAIQVDNLNEPANQCNVLLEQYIIRIRPFFQKCIEHSEKNGPGMSFFKFLSQDKIKSITQRNGIDTKFNCEYHYIPQTSFYWKKVLGTRMDDILYEWNKHILIVIHDNNRNYIKLIDKHRDD